MTYTSARFTEFDRCFADAAFGCLIGLARRHHHLIDEQVLAADLAVDAAGRISVSDIPRAAGRAGFIGMPLALPLDAVSPDQLPALLMLAEGDVCALTAWQRDGSGEALLPDTAGPVVIPASTLAARYTGLMITLKPCQIPTDDEEQPVAGSGRSEADWHRHLPVAFAALPGDALALFLAVLLPHFAHHWGSSPRMVATAAGVAILLDGLIRAARHLLLRRVVGKIETELGQRFFRRLLNQAQPGPTGACATALKAIQTERADVIGSMVALLAEAPLLAALWFALAWLGGPLVAVPLMAVPGFLVLGLGLQPVGRPVIQRLVGNEARQQAFLVETLGSVDTIRASGAAARWERKWAEQVAATARSVLAAGFVDLGGRRLPQSLQLVALVGMAAWGSRLVAQHQMQAASLAVCLLIGAQLLAAMGEAAGLLARWPGIGECLASLRDLRPRTPDQRRTEPRLVRPQLREGIVMTDVAFRYPKGQRPVLDGACLQIRSGDRVALTGPAGTGKTTAAKLMLGLLPPDRGEIWVDGRRPSHPSANAAALFGYLPQDPTLFSGTLHDNLALRHPEAQGQAIHDAATLAGVEDLLSAQGPNGRIEEYGLSLSAGQRQAVALARILVDAPSVLLLDDPCASWSDNDLEGLANRLATILEGRTLILLTQRRPLLALAHHVFRMDGGMIRSAG